MVQNVKMALIESEIVNFYKALYSRHLSGGAWFEGGMKKQTESVNLKGNQDQAGSLCPPTRQSARMDSLWFSFKGVGKLSKTFFEVFFFSKGKTSKGIKRTFITLNPKKLGATSIQDFRPISLISGPYY